MTDQADKGADTRQTRTPMALLALAALGIVHGDIGTSPLHAFKQSPDIPVALRLCERAPA